MADLELTRTSAARRLYALEGVGTLSLRGVLGRAAIAEAEGSTWRFARRRFWGPVEVTDAADRAVGAFEPRGLGRRGGTLRWGGREFALRAASGWRERYALAVGDREVALLDGKGWGRRPVKVSVDDMTAVEPGLLLFAAFVVRGLARIVNPAHTAATTASAHGGHGRYAAIVSVPSGGIGHIQIGIIAQRFGPTGTHSARFLFPITNSP